MGAVTTAAAVLTLAGCGDLFASYNESLGRREVHSYVGRDSRSFMDSPATSSRSFTLLSCRTGVTLSLTEGTVASLAPEPPQEGQPSFDLTVKGSENEISLAVFVNEARREGQLTLDTELLTAAKNAGFFASARRRGSAPEDIEACQRLFPEVEQLWDTPLSEFCEEGAPFNTEPPVEEACLSAGSNEGASN